MVLHSFQLVMRTGPTPEKVFALSQTEVYIGRDISNDIVINDAEVSRKHARLVLQSGQYVIEDLGSTNGTFINRARISGPQALRPGDTVQLGENVTMVYEISRMDPDATIANMGAPVVQPYEPYAAPARPATQPPTPTPVPSYPANPPVVEVPPAYQAPPPAPVPVPAPARATYPPPQPQAVPPAQKKAPARQKTYIYAGIGCLVVFICLVVPLLALWWIDSQSMWCTVFPFLTGCP